MGTISFRVVRSFASRGVSDLQSRDSFSAGTVKREEIRYLYIFRSLSIERFVGGEKNFEVDSLFNGKPMKSTKERSNMIKLFR